MVILTPQKIYKQIKCEIACYPTPLKSWVELFLIFTNQQSKRGKPKQRYFDVLIYVSLTTMEISYFKICISH